MRRILTLLLFFFLSFSSWAAVIEVPSPGSIQSGLGFASGWKCTASSITISFDGGPHIPVSYGSPRGDTRGICGDDNNGWIVQWNWNLLGDGPHIIRAFDGGMQFASALFTVKTLGHEFLRGLFGQTKVINFGNQINVTVRWQESTQSFVIVDATAPLRIGPPVGYNPGGGLPFCETPDAGRAASAADIDAFARHAGFLSTHVNLCAVNVDNPQYGQVSGNARAFRTDQGFVYYDVTLLNTFDAVNEFADDLILAHEWGHQVQFDNFSRASLPGTKAFELQADCLAGIYFGHLRFANPEFMQEDAQALLMAACSMGLMENFVWGSIGSHGKCEERALAFALGHDMAYLAYTTQSSFDPFLVCS
jgi:hypothetical protein